MEPGWAQSSPTFGSHANGLIDKSVPTLAPAQLLHTTLEATQNPAGLVIRWRRDSIAGGVGLRSWDRSHTSRR